MNWGGPGPVVVSIIVNYCCRQKILKETENEEKMGSKVTTSDNFCAGFKSLSFSQAGYSVLAASKGTNPETAGLTAIENNFIVTFLS